MGYMRHHAFIVTCWNEEKAQAAHAEALRLFPSALAPECLPTPPRVSPLIPSPVNDYWTFLVAPDGSKEGWDASDAGDRQRAQFAAWLEGQRSEDGGTAYDWVEVQYGDAYGENRVLQDEESRRADFLLRRLEVMEGEAQRELFRRTEENEALRSALRAREFGR